MKSNNNKLDYDYIFKMLLIGESGVGKSSLAVRYMQNKYSAEHITTIGMDYMIKTIDVNVGGVDYRVKLQIWDTAGQERFRAMTPAYFNNSHGAILVFALNDLGSFERLQYWKNEVRDERCRFYLVGNKCDLDNAVAPDVIQEAYPGIPYISTSAKTGEGVPWIFLSFATLLVEEALAGRLQDTTPKPDFVVLAEKEGGEAKEQQQPQRCCGGTG